MAWAELAYTETAARLTDSHRELLSAWEQVAHTRYTTGLGSEADIFQAQIELATLDDRSRSLADLRLPLRASLNAHLGRPSHAPLPASPETPDPPTSTLDETDLRLRVHASNPELLRLHALERAAAARVELAESAAWPDASLGVDFTRVGRGGDDAWALTGGLTLPIQRGRVHAVAREAEARQLAQVADRRDLLLQLEARLQRVLYDLRDAERRQRLYSETLLPKGQQTVQALDAAYQVGEVAFLQLIDAERVLLEFELAVARARTDRELALARLDVLLGHDPSAEATP